MKFFRLTAEDLNDPETLPGVFYEVAVLAGKHDPTEKRLKTIEDIYVHLHELGLKLLSCYELTGDTLEAVYDAYLDEDGNLLSTLSDELMAGRIWKGLFNVLRDQWRDKPQTLPSNSDELMTLVLYCGGWEKFIVALERDAVMKVLTAAKKWRIQNWKMKTL